MSSIKGLNGIQHIDLNNFLQNVEKFNGTIINGKIIGKCDVLYKNGDIY